MHRVTDGRIKLLKIDNDFLAEYYVDKKESIPIPIGTFIKFRLKIRVIE